ncbi:YFMJ_1 [Blepharisma stoltei]|uniref:Enoyl reductase (ER) domain-containing protein n=1 Tax=Blepharisma stoltei TaxID=1481888 RepID=A0AAU9IQI2_9CILI|nr:unnamed protein product [Blepharisma stoltei]
MNKRVILAKRPVDLPKDEDFSVIEEPIGQLKEGEVLVKVEWLSVDASQRVYISGQRSYTDPVPVGGVIKGLGIGQVIESQSHAFKKGNYVSGLLGWQEYSKLPANHLTLLPPHENPRLFLGVLGITGLTAYFTVNELAKPKQGETMLVSTAAGAVGSLICQMGKMKGCKVIGLTGSDEKCQYLTRELGIDGAINYKKVENLSQAIKAACPDGVDVYIDNVGGEILDAALLNINKYARIVMCGAISSYNKKTAPPVHYYPLIISMSATIVGFIVFDFKNKYGLATKHLSKWLQQKKLKFSEHVVDGLENAPSALRLLLKGENTGKVLVRVTSGSPKL